MTAELERQQVALEAMASAQAVLGLGRHAKALESDLAKLCPEGADGAAVELARTLARAMDAVPDDDHHALALLAPRLGAALKALGLTPESTARHRAAPTPGGTKLSRFY
jgi:hypothetical protein